MRSSSSKGLRPVTQDCLECRHYDDTLRELKRRINGHQMHSPAHKCKNSSGALNRSSKKNLLNTSAAGAATWHEERRTCSTNHALGSAQKRRRLRSAVNKGKTMFTQKKRRQEPDFIKADLANTQRKLRLSMTKDNFCHRCMELLTSGKSTVYCDHHMN